MPKKNNINFHGRLKLPFEKMLRLIKHISTTVESSTDTEKKNYHLNRNKKELAYSKKIIKLYHPNKNIARPIRYTNPKITNMIPDSFWKKFKMDKNRSRVQIMHHPPGTVSIPHIDRYHRMMQDLKLKNDPSKRKHVRRIWISLTEPKLGHALFVGNEVAYNLKRGTILTFNADIPHSGCNVGDEDRFVLTVTGFYG